MLKSVALLFVICPGLLLIHAYTAPGPFLSASRVEITAEPEYPEKTGEIIRASCYDCHTSGTEAKDAVEALNFKTFNEYRITKRIGLLNEICEQVTEGHMPPRKYLRFHPEKALSEAETELICEWAKKTAEKLME